MHSIITSELKYLANKVLIRMEEIEKWLSRNKELRDRCFQIYSSQHLYFIDSQYLRLPDDLSSSTLEEKLVDVYDTLDELKKLHSKEEYFKRELTSYYQNSQNIKWISKWIARNETIAYQEFLMFLIDYLDYDDNENEYHLKLFFLNSKDLDLYVERDDFCNTIKFLETL